MRNEKVSSSIQTDSQTQIYLENWSQKETSTGVLLVHGGPGLYGYMGDLAQEISNKEYSVWTYFQRNGEWSRSTGPVTVETHMADLKALLEKLKQEVESLILVGHSWGALLSLRTLQKYPGLAKKMVLIGPMPMDLEGVGIFGQTIDSRLSPKELKSRMDRFAELMALTDPKAKNEMFLHMSDSIFKTYQHHPVLDLLSSKLDGVDADSFFATHTDLAQILSREDLISSFKSLKVPVDVIYGDYDPSPCARLTKQLKEVMPQLSFTEISNCGHYPWWEAPEVKNQFYSALFQSFANGESHS